MRRFSTYRNPHGDPCMLDQRTGNVLKTNSSVHDEGRAVVINTRIHGVALPVTGRGIDQYRRAMPGLVEDATENTIVEAGAGLGDYVPFVVEMNQDKPGFRRPTVIDPADYRSMPELLRTAMDHPDFEPYRFGIARRLERCMLLLDPERVRLLNMRLGDALNNYPDLEAKADVVVELCGPLLYPETEGIMEVTRSHLQRLLRLSGRLFMGTVC